MSDMVTVDGDPFEREFRKHERIFQRMFPEPPAVSARKTMLIFDRGARDQLAYQIYIYRMFQERGWRLVVVAWRNEVITRYYELLSPIEIRYWDEFTEDTKNEIEDLPVDPGLGLEALSRERYRGIRVWLHCIAEAYRSLCLEKDRSRVPTIDDAVAAIPQWKERALKAAGAVKAVFDRYRPAMALFGDASYTLQGSAFDECVSRGIDAVRIATGSIHNSLSLKRNHRRSLDDLPIALSDVTWRRMKSLPWGEEVVALMQAELDAQYESKTWYAFASLLAGQITKVDESRVRMAVGAPEGKRVVGVFAHLLWDAPFYGCRRIFDDYAEWLVATVKCIRDVPEVHWVIKFHPANLYCRANPHFACTYESSLEEELIGEHFASLPDHITFLRPDTDITAQQFLSVLDGVVTVQGTAGLEAAIRGIPVVAGGGPYYGGRGFTIDSATREDYFRALKKLATTERLSVSKRIDACRYAAVAWFAKTLRVSSFDLNYSTDGASILQAETKIRTARELFNAPDMRALSKWMFESDEDDYLDEEMLAKFGPVEGSRSLLSRALDWLGRPQVREREPVMK